MNDEPLAWRYYAAALSAALLPALLAALLVWQVRSADYASAGRSVLTTAKGVAGDFDNTFEQFDALLKSIARQYVDGVESGSEEKPRLIQRLQEELANIPFSSRVFIADSYGRLVLGGGAAVQYATTGVSVADRDYFARSKAGEQGLMFEGPHRAKFGDEQVIVLARRLEDGKGGFLGVVAGSIPVAYFQTRIARDELDPHGDIVFRTTNGARIAVHSADPADPADPGGVGVSEVAMMAAPASPALFQGREGQTLYQAASPLDHIDRLLAYQKLSHAPFYLLVGQSTASVDRSWRRLASELGLLCLGVTLAGLWSARRLHASAVTLRRERSLLKQRIADRTRELEDSAQELSAVLDSVVTRQESDRRRIARELHDRLGQYLAAMNLKLGALERCGPDVALLKSGLSDLKDLTGAVGSEVGRIAWELRPVALDDIGLESAVRHFIEEWVQRSGLRFDLHLALKGRRLPPEVETTLYRVLQESVTNVVKHAAASAVGVTLTTSPNDVVMTVEDDGVGFDVDEVSRASPRLGLRGMRERLAVSHGSLDIESRPGGGTTLTIRIPLAGRAP
ncbi:signal transduction histidine kinase [Roseiarcus fermentans]|uniref:histidine kinase n=1 Tax=Roseiarcus fermentans TaxID=1473586 RepID=A0A366EL43_9HYPH|nr:ATP-binding protein [Roseiarcus fermentans]RBP03111.1 signal transduction histidine kinase [Roseiarcus fermentans]